MNEKVRRELLSTIDNNVYKTNYIDMTLEEIKSVLIRQGFGEAESNMISASVKYIIELRNYVKPKLTDVQKQRVCEYWSNVQYLDTLKGAWGDMSVTQLNKKFIRFKLYNQSYVDYIINSHPEITYDLDQYHNSKYGGNNKMIKVDKLVDILYEDYLEIRKEIGYGEMKGI